MLHVTTCAVGLAGKGFDGARVKPGVGVEPLFDFQMTFQTAKSLGSRAEVVTVGALRDAFE